MVTGRNPTLLPYPYIDGLTKRQQEQLYLDFEALANLGKGSRWRTIVIAASDSSAAGRKGADYRCSGVGDEAVINAAIAALETRAATASLGRIVLLEGTYSLAAQITVNTLTRRQIAIEGMGSGTGQSIAVGGTVAGTVLVLASTSDNAIFCGGSSASSGSTVIIENLAVRGGSSSPLIAGRDMTMVVRNCNVIQTSTGGGIQQTASTGAAPNTRIEKCSVVCTGGGSGSGIEAQVGPAPGGATSAHIEGNYVEMASTSAKAVALGNNGGTVPNYLVRGNHLVGPGTSGTSFGIGTLGTSVQRCVVEGNLIVNFNTGVSLSGYQHVVVGNAINSCAVGFQDAVFQLDYSLIGANNIYGCTTGVNIGSTGGTSCTGNSIIGNRISQGTSAIVIGSHATATGLYANDINSGGTVTDGGTSTRTLTGLPAGGTAGQLLTKNSATDYDASWTTYVDTVLAAIAAKGDLIVGTAAGTITNLQLSAATAGDSYSGQILLTDPTSVTGLKWGPTVTVGNVAPTSPKAGDIWIDTT